MHQLNTRDKKDKRAFCIAGLHHSLTGHDLDEQDLQAVLTNVFTTTEEKTVFNETRTVERLKIHLIYQGRDKEAKSFIEAHQRLKKSFGAVLRRRECIMRLLYETFDREHTRTAMMSSSRRSKLESHQSQNTNMPAGSSLPQGSNFSIGSYSQNQGTNVSNASNPHSQNMKSLTGSYAQQGQDQKEVRSNAERIGEYAKSIAYRNRISEPVTKPEVEVKNSMKNGEKSRVVSTPAYNSSLNHSKESNTSNSNPRPTDLSSFVTMRRSGQGVPPFQRNESSYRSSSQIGPYSSPNKHPILQQTMEFDQDFNPMPMPVLHKPSDEDMRDLLHRSTNKVPSLMTSRIVDPAASTIFRSPTSIGQQSSMMVFPPDHGRYLLSARSENQGITQSSTRVFNTSKRVGSATSPSQVGSLPRFSRSSRSVVGLNNGTQKTLLRDLVYVFQGINGSAIKAVSKDNSFEICAPRLHPSLRLQALRLCEAGYFFVKIKAYCDKPATGLMIQGFKHGLENELQEFYRLLAIITTQLQVEVVDTPMSEELASFQESEIMTLHKLTIWTFDSRYRLEVLASMIDACENKSGGELCSIIYRYTEHGDAMVASMTNSLLTIVTKPLFLILCQWILYGELEDPHNEFFIASDKDCKKEDLWHSKFHIREKMLPCFISLKRAQKILATGKNINFLKDICHNSKGYEGRNEIREILESTPVECIFLEDDRVLANAIDSAYRTTSEMVLKVLIEESRLLDHLRAIKKYLLLGQGDFIQYLLELLQDELNKPVSKLYTHNLSAILESAVRATNAQFEDEDILSRLDTRILPGNDRETGWDVFCLDYKADGPIGTVLTEEVIVRYNQLFNTLWRTKRIEAMLSTLWKNQTTLFKFQKVMPELGPVLHQSQLLISEMIHFVHQTQYYIMFEVTECAWDSLMEEVRKAADLDHVIKAHESFLETITKRALLDIGKRDLLNQLRGIFDTIHLLKSFLTKFDDRVTVEMYNRQGHASQPTSAETLEAQKHFFIEYVAHAKGEIERIYGVTQDLVRSFLLVLNRQQDSDSLTLQCLSFRLDFSEYYAHKDARLNFPLTYLHRRRSSIGSFNSPYYPSSLNQSLNQSMNQSNGSYALTQSFPGPGTSHSMNEQTFMSSSIPEFAED